MYGLFDLSDMEGGGGVSLFRITAFDERVEQKMKCTSPWEGF